MTLTTRLTSPNELTQDEVASWSRIQESVPMLESPYFRPEFTLSVAAARDDVEIAVLEDDGEAVGFLPFQRVHPHVAVPVGGRLSDFHGAIVDPELEWNVENVLRDCNITCWNFDHLVASQSAFTAHHFDLAESPYLDLSSGFEAYQRERREAGSKRIKTTMKKARKLEREIGEVRFVAHVDDPHVLETLLAWKSAQYRESKLTDLFAFDWTRQLLEYVNHYRSESFRGMMSVLYAGDRIAAIDLGMRSHGVLHSWFPAYDRGLAKYAPGHVLLVEMAKACESLGIRSIHLGKGDEAYKTSFTNHSVNVATGTVDLNPARRIVKRTWHRTCEWARRSPLRRVLRRPARFVRRAIDHVSMF